MRDIITQDANILFEIFKSNVDSDGLVTDKGLNKMSDFFGLIPMENRAYVYMRFVDMLAGQDISYDVDQFMGMETVH